MNKTTITSAELFVATGCHYCPVVLDSLSKHLKQGQLANLSITNIAVKSERADKLSIRSVPWFSLSNTHVFMIFSGNHTEKEIQKWLNLSKHKDSMQKYIEECLSTGQLMTVMQVMQLKPKMYSHVIAMLEDEETSMDIRIGLDALTESLAASDILKKHVEDFKRIASNDNTRLQIDALHYIALTGDAENNDFLKIKTKDSNAQISEAAIEALDTLNDLIN